MINTIEDCIDNADRSFKIRKIKTIDGINWYEYMIRTGPPWWKFWQWGVKEWESRHFCIAEQKEIK